VFRAVQRAVRSALVESSPIPEVSPDAWIGPAPVTSAPTPPPAVEVQVPLDLPREPVRASLEPREDVHPTWQDGKPHPHEEQQTVQEKLPPLRVVGQVGATYIVAEGPNGLYLIDQHAAHERILYEQMMEELNAGSVASQGLLSPLTVEMDPMDAAAVSENLDILNRLGFDVEHFGGNTFILRSIPSVLQKQDPRKSLLEVARGLLDGKNLVEKEREEALIRAVCKRAAIKGGQILSAQEMEALVRQLEQTKSPRTCPHGRPTVLVVSASTLEKMFGRRQ